MEKVYEPLPLDEESRVQSTQSGRTRRVWIESDGWVSKTQRFAQNWPWLIHAVLLSVSTTLFALSLCVRSREPTDLDYTRKYSTWCK
jgi:hypothetical protein